MAEANSYRIDFSNASPDLVEVRNVSSLDVEDLEIPVDAMQFSLFDENHAWIGPAYFVTNDVEFGSLETMRSQYPNALLHKPNFDFDKAVPYGLVTWDGQSDPHGMGSMLIPVIEGVSAIYDRWERRPAFPNSK